MKIIGIIDCDTVNYKKPSLTVMFPKCDFKCDKEYGEPLCQNSSLAQEPLIEIEPNVLIDRYYKDPAKALVFQGLEPFDSLEDMVKLIKAFREVSKDDIVIYTGYNESEVAETVKSLGEYSPLIIKYGRYLPNQKPHYDDVLGVELASDNQKGVFY